MRRRLNAPTVKNILFKDFIFKFSLIWLLTVCFMLYSFVPSSIENIRFIYDLGLLLSFHAAGLWMLYFSIKRAKRINRLFLSGKTTTANISYLMKTCIVNNTPLTATIFYEFEYRGEIHDGKTKSVPYAKTKRMRNGDQINIIYNPKDLSETVWADLFKEV